MRRSLKTWELCKPSSMTEQSPTTPPVDLDRLIQLVEFSIQSQDGKMILDIHVDDELRDAIRGTLNENIEWGNGEEYAIESALRNVFAAHETHMKQAATDAANMGLRRAMDSLPNSNCPFTGEKGKAHEKKIGKQNTSCRSHDLFSI